MSDEFKIEKNVPIVESRGQSPKYPFDKMEVGDSFFVHKDVKEKHNVSSAAFMYAKRYPPVKFKTRKTDDGIRIWRIA